jgi:hypothetical protein
MKKLFILFLLCLNNYAGAQKDTLQNPLKQPSQAPPKDTIWKTPGLISLNVSQTSLSNWQGGGQDNLALIALFKFDPVYRKDIYAWTGKVDTQYGLIKQGANKLYRKNIDRLFLLSKFDVKAAYKHWYYSAQSDFRTQFAPGYDYRGDSIAGRANSDLFSPAYIQLALGMDFKLEDYFSVTFAPLAGKITTVNRQYLADDGAFGVTPALRDTAGNIISRGKRNRYEFGGRVVIKFKKEVIRNVLLDTYIDLFSNYANNPTNIDVVINNTLTFKISRFFSANIISQLLYDDDIIIKYDWNKDGQFTHPNDINGPRLQALTTIAFGFAYKF